MQELQPPAVTLNFGAPVEKRGQVTYPVEFNSPSVRNANFPGDAWAGSLLEHVARQLDKKKHTAAPHRCQYSSCCYLACSVLFHR